MKARLTAIIIVTVAVVTGVTAWHSLKTREALKGYVRMDYDLARQCITKCGENSLVVGFGALNNQLECECQEVEVSVVPKGKKKKAKSKKN